MSTKNRKLPADAELCKLFDAGLTNTEVSVRCAVSRTAVRRMRQRLRPYEVKAAAPKLVEARRYPVPDASKVVKKVDVAAGLGFTTLFISLPRIATIHGHYIGDQ